MRKFSIAALVAVAALAGSVISATADTGAGDTEWTFTVSVTKVNKPAASHSIGKPAKKGDDGYYVAPKKQIFGFPVGSQVDTTALPHCTTSESDVGRGEECPENTRLGKGSANVIVGQNKGTGAKGSELVAEFSAWNRKGKILFVFQTCGKGGPGTGSPCQPAGPPNIVIGTWKDALTAPKLHVPTPEQLLKIGVIIIRFELFTDKHTKTVRKDGKRVLKSYIFTPKKCTGVWKTYDKATYVDGTGQTIKDSQKCTKP